MLKLRITLLSALCLCHFTSPCSPEFQKDGARSAGMGHSSVGLTDLWSIHSNQAGLAFIKEVSFGISINNQFLIKELNRGSVVFGIPFRRSGTIGFSIDNLGFAGYSENMVGLAYAMTFGSDFSAGLKLNLLRISYPAEKLTRNFLGFDLGILYRVNKDLNLAAHISNPYSYAFTRGSDERLVPRVSLGLTHYLNSDILVCLEIEKIVSRKPRLKTGIEYSLKNKLFLRCGILSSPFQFSFGFGYCAAGFSFDIASLYHRYLGFSPQISIQYSIRRRP